MTRSYAEAVFPARSPGARTLWEEGHESGRAMVALGAAVLLTAVVLDRWWGGDLGWLGWRLHREGEADIATELSRELSRPA